MNIQYTYDCKLKKIRKALDGYECSINGPYHVRKLGNGVKALFHSPHISRWKLDIVNGPVDGSTNSVDYS